MLAIIPRSTAFSKAEKINAEGRQGREGKDLSESRIHLALSATSALIFLALKNKPESIG